MSTFRGIAGVGQSNEYYTTIKKTKGSLNIMKKYLCYIVKWKNQVIEHYSVILFF